MSTTETSESIAGAPPNVEVSHDSFSGHVEPDVAVNPANGQNLLVASQVAVGPHVLVPAAYTSFDGGASWRNGDPLKLPAGFPHGADTTVGFDSSGEGYVVALASDRAGAGYPSRTRAGEILIWRSGDRGRSFSAPTVIYRGPGFQDHPWLAIDSSQPRPQPLFVVWDSDAGIMLAESRDGGRHFGSARVLTAEKDTLDATPVVITARARVWVLYQHVGPSTITIKCLHSRDGGRSFYGPAAVGTASEQTLAGEISKKRAGPPPLLSAAADGSGDHVYAAISSFDASAGHPTDVVWRSSSSAQTWEGPAPVAGAVAASPGQTQPRLTVGPDGDVYVLYLATDGHGRMGIRLSESSDEGRRFGSDRWVSNMLSSANGWLAHYHGWFGDYQGLTVSSGIAHAVWNDDRSGELQLEAAEMRVR